MKPKHTIEHLKQQRAGIRFESEDDEGAAEWYAHLSDVIDQLENGTMTVQQASESLGMNLTVVA